eukprot:Tbor_TRINITY_DN6162_c0_g3::TRINITY_DN6162_c0_g3_i10::g.22448::m.22448
MSLSSNCFRNWSMKHHRSRNPFHTHSVFLVVGILLSCVIAPVTLAYHDIKAENELLDAPTFTDWTLPRGGGRKPTIHGFRPMASDATITIVNKTFTNLNDGDWLHIIVDRPGAKSDVNATTTDWVGIFPAGVAVDKTLPIALTLCSVDPNYKTTGKATLKMRLLNTRTPLEIVFLTKCVVKTYYMADTSIKECHATERSEKITFADYNTPLRPAAIPTLDPTVIRVVWTSVEVKSPYLEYRKLDEAPKSAADLIRSVPQETKYPMRVDATSKKPAYAREEICAAPANTFGYFDPGARHSAMLRNLKPGSWYGYRFGDVSGSHISDEYALWVPLGADPEANITLITFGDLGRKTQDDSKTWSDYGLSSLNTTRRITQFYNHLLENKQDLASILHVGDISYAAGYLNIWDTYAEMVTKMVAHVPYAILLGNHDTGVTIHQTPKDRVVTNFNWTDSGGECSVPVNGWYPMPWKSIDEPWYSYNIGPVHIIASSSEHVWAKGSPQYSWIEKDLKAVNRSITPWIIFAGHRPMYIDSNKTGFWSAQVNVMNMLVEELEPLLLKYKVDLALWGHNHVVQRFCAFKNHTCVVSSELAPFESDISISPSTVPTFPKDNGGIVHIVVGAGGANFHPNVNIPWNPTTENAFYEYGYSVIRVEKGDRLTWQWFSNQQAD